MTDNGTVFTSQERQKFATNRNIEWQFSLSASWYGGFWERLVSIVKRCLKKTVGKACLNFYELQIILSEIEMIINSRPLNTLHDDEIYEVMTPNHLLFGQKLYQENPKWESNSDIVEPDLRKRIEYVESIIEHFWKRWRFEYITSLRECQKSFKPKNQLFQAKNDLVLIYEEEQPRQKWLLGKIVELIPSQDGQVRGARILLGKSRNTADRPVNRQYPFVLTDSEQNKVHEVMKEGLCGPKQEAAELAKFRIRYAPGIN